MSEEKQDLFFWGPCFWGRWRMGSTWNECISRLADWRQDEWKVGPSLSGTVSILAGEFKCYLLGGEIISKSFWVEGSDVQSRDGDQWAPEVLCDTEWTEHDEAGGLERCLEIVAVCGCFDKDDKCSKPWKCKWGELPKMFQVRQDGGWLVWWS